MSLSPRPALTSLSAAEILARDKEGFPRKNSVTFGEVVSTFSKYGSVASRRHGGIYISKSLKIPNRFSTISDNTLKLEQPNLRDSRDSVGRASPRSSYLAALARSRTPSPCARRPRSLPLTPRSCVAPLRSSWEPRRKEWPEFGQRLSDVYGAGGYADGVEAPRLGASSQPRLPAEPVAAGHSRDPTPRGTAASLTPGGTFCGGTVGYSGGGTGGSSGRHAVKAKPSLTCLSCGNAVTSDAAFCRHCGAKRATNQDSSSPALSPASQVVGGSAGQASAGRSFPVLSSTGPQPRDGDALGDKWSTDYGRAMGSPKGNPRVASFVRLNGFLLRTHITSLLSALAEDGWLEAWEKERLCSTVRDGESRWAQSFLQIYTRFVETDDVATFVAALKAQIT